MPAEGHAMIANPGVDFFGRDIVLFELRDFSAPGGRIKSFATVIARKPAVRDNCGC